MTKRSKSRRPRNSSSRDSSLEDDSGATTLTSTDQSIFDLRFPQWRNLLRKEQLAELFVYAMFSIFGKIFWSLILPITERDSHIQQVDGTNILNPLLMNGYISNDDVTITDITLGILGIAGPMTFFAVASSCVLRQTDDFATSDALSAYMVALGLNEFATEFGKRYVGRLRPNFYGMCGFDEDTLSCTASEARIEQSRKSFPSGHASLSFCAMVLISRWLLKIVVSHEISNRSGRGTMEFTLRVLGVTVVPLSFAFFVATSRIYDSWHHPSDVIAGSLIGTFSACLSFRMFFGDIDWATVVVKRAERRSESRVGGDEGRLLDLSTNSTRQR